MGRRELSAADIYCKFAAQLDEDGFRLYHAAQRITGFQPYDAFPYEDNRGAFEAADGHTLLRYLEAAHFDAVTWEIVPGTTDAAVEKHVPVWTVENGIVHVKVGSVEHPMLPEHYIEWVSLHTKQGNQRKELHPGEKPEVCFALCEGDEVEAVYAYCNLHSLWKA